MTGWLRRTSDLLASGDPGPVDFLVDEILVDKCIGVMHGRWKVGKSWLVLDLAIAIVTGQPALGRYAVPNPGPVMLVMEESGERAYHRRADMMARGRAIRPEQLHDLRYAANAGIRLNDPRWRDELRQAVDDVQPRAVFLDPLARLKGGDVNENDQREIGPVLDFMRDLRDLGPAVIYVHHAGHLAPDRQRGSSDLEAYWESSVAIADKDGGTEIKARHREAEDSDPIRYRRLHDPETRTVVLTCDGVGRDYRAEILASLDGEPLTSTAIAKAIKARRSTVDDLLAALADEGLVQRSTGPNGATLHTSSRSLGRAGTSSGPHHRHARPTGVYGDPGTSNGTETKSSSRPPGRPSPLAGDHDYLQHLFGAFEHDLTTETEWRRGEAAHRLIRARQATETA